MTSKHPSGFTPMITHIAENGVKTQVVDRLDDDAVSDAQGLASEIEWQLRRKDDDSDDYIHGGTATWALGEDKSTGERWLIVQLDPTA